jgi:hypothetical protein
MAGLCHDFIASSQFIRDRDTGVVACHPSGSYWEVAWAGKGSGLSAGLRQHLFEACSVREAQGGVAAEVVTHGRAFQLRFLSDEQIGADAFVTVAAGPADDLAGVRVSPNSHGSGPPS